METIAVFTGDRSQPRPSEYRHHVIDTEVSFRYRAYHIFDHTQEELLAMDNAFGLIVLACQKALLEGSLKQGLLEERAKAEAEKLAAKKESAIKMLQNGFDVELIADIIGLPIDEIEKLK